MNIHTNTDPRIPAEYLAKRIVAKLESGKKVLWFITGGSSVSVQLLAAKIIAEYPHAGLTVTLTDERFGPPGHADSNWQKTLGGGFALPQAKLLPVLTGKSRDTTVEHFNGELAEEMEKADYIIGLFGVGADGHTAGILPHTEAARSTDLAYGYSTAQFERITITPRTIQKIHEAVIFMQGKDKWPVIKDLREKDMDIFDQPAQALKKIPEATLFTDYV